MTRRITSIARLTKKDYGSDLNRSHNEWNSRRNIHVGIHVNCAEPGIRSTKFVCPYCCEPVHQSKNDLKNHYPEDSQSEYSFGRRKPAG